MQSLGQKLSDAAQHNHELLTTLSQTDYALMSHKQNGEYIKDLKGRIDENNKKLKSLHSITEDERKDHVKYRDSTVKRFLYKLGGQKGETKFSAKADKEEREFLEAWQKEREGQEYDEQLQRALSQAEHDRVGLEADKSRNEAAQRELDTLYQSIFEGPTPELPDEDHIEQAVRQAGDHFQQCQAQLGMEKQAQTALRAAGKSLMTANANINDASNWSRMDMYGGGMWADMAERDALSNTEVFIRTTAKQIQEAQRSQPAIESIGKVDIDNGHFTSDIIFDSIWTDLAQHERIMSTHTQISQAIPKLQSEIDKQDQRTSTAKQTVDQAAASLDVARRDLQATRAQAFQTYAANGYTAPPSYS